MTPEELQAALTTARLRVNDWHACASAEELARWRADQANLIIAAKASVYPEVEALAAKLQEAEQEIAAAMVILAPNIQSSGLVDACKQVKQVAISEADNSEKFEAKLQEIRAERAKLELERDEKAAIIQAAGHELDELRARAESAKARQAAAEHRAQRVLLEIEASRGEVVKPAAQTTEQFRAEVKDKLGVVFNGCHSTPLQRAINRQQCEDFLVERYAEACLERGEVVKACPHCNQFYALESTAGNYVCHRCYRAFTEPALWQRVTPSCR